MPTLLQSVAEPGGVAWASLPSPHVLGCRPARPPRDPPPGSGGRGKTTLPVPSTHRGRPKNVKGGFLGAPRAPRSLLPWAEASRCAPPSQRAPPMSPPLCGLARRRRPSKHSQGLLLRRTWKCCRQARLTLGRSQAGGSDPPLVSRVFSKLERRRERAGGSRCLVFPH